MTTPTSAIAVEQLTKRFSGGVGKPDVVALNAVTLEVARGEIFGLLGPNGAGKTTLVKILLGALLATGGRAFINGTSVTDTSARKQVGFLPENHRFPQYMTGYQMLRVYGGMSGLSNREVAGRAPRLLELVDMTRWRNTKIKKYSKGMMQRMGLAQALIHDPEIIFLDEPTDGVDPVGRRQIRDILKDLKKQGKTIFLNSHLLAEVEAVCDRVAVLNKGKVLKVGPVAHLVDTRPGYTIDVFDRGEKALELIQQKVPAATFDGIKLSVAVESNRDINGLIDLLRQNNIEIRSVIPVTLSLEDSFIQLITEQPAEVASE